MPRFAIPVSSRCCLNAIEGFLNDRDGHIIAYMDTLIMDNALVIAKSTDKSRMACALAIDDKGGTISFLTIIHYCIG